MRLPQLKKRKWNYLLLSYLLPLTFYVILMAWAGYTPFGDKSLLYSDKWHQYFPFFKHYRSVLREGGSLLYNWDIGMGLDYLGLISYYLASPLNLLSVLVPEGWLLGYFSLLVPMKLGFASLFFAILLKKLFGKDDFSLCVFGAFYGLCAWALGFQWNVMWLDTFALLPLVVLGMVSLLRDRKFILYTLSLFLAVFANYYIGFFVCIFVFLLFFVYEICRWQGWKRFAGDLMWIALFSLIAIGMTAVLELPAFAALQTTQSSVNKFPTSFRLNIADSHTIFGLLDAMRQVAGNMGGALEPNFKEGLPNLYCGVGSILFAFLYLQAKEVKIRDKICAVFLLLFFNVSFIIRQLDYIWHGFHFTNMIPYRFSFLYSFVLLYMAYRAWTLRREFSVLQILLAGFLTMAILSCSNDLVSTKDVQILSATVPVPVYLIYNVSFLALYLAALGYGAIRQKVPEDAEPQEQEEILIDHAQRRMAARMLVFLFMGAELIAGLVSFGLYFPGTGVSNYPKGTKYAASMIRYMKEREDDNLFYRAETTHSQTLNDGALNGYNGVSAFTSSANVHVTEFMQALGYGAKNTYNRYCYEESSPVANLFLNLKYMIERDGKDRSSAWFTDVHHYGDVHLLENNAYLPLGFLAEPALTTVNFQESDGKFAFQNELFSAATGLDANIWSQLQGEKTSIVGNGVTIQESNSYGYCDYSNAAAHSSITYSYIVDKAGFGCIHLDLPKRNSYSVILNGVELYQETISLPQMIAVGDLKEGDILDIRISCKEGEDSYMTVIAAVMDNELFQAGYEVLSASVLELDHFENTRVDGTITCNRDGILYTSIPQNGNWKAWVDGKPAQIVLTGDAMVSLCLEEGEHSVSFRYRNGAFALGWKISLVCTLALLVFVQINYRPDWKQWFSRATEKFHQ